MCECDLPSFEMKQWEHVKGYHVMTLHRYTSIQTQHRYLVTCEHHILSTISVSLSPALARSLRASPLPDHGQVNQLSAQPPTSNPTNRKLTCSATSQPLSSLKPLISTLPADMRLARIKIKPRGVLRHSKSYTSSSLSQLFDKGKAINGLARHHLFVKAAESRLRPLQPSRRQRLQPWTRRIHRR